MKVWQIKAYGGSDVMELAEVPKPEPKPHEARVKVQAAGLNYSDVMIRRGSYVDTIPLPLRLGREFAGVIDAVGKDVRGWMPGQRVAGMAGSGAFGEFVTLPAASLLPVPAQLEAPKAAAFALQGITAVHMIDDLARLKEGQTLLVHAAAGGVGVLALQIGRMRGAKVIGTVSSDAKADVVKRFGATPVNYTEEKWVDKVLELTKGKGADVILESVGGEIFLQSFRKALATFGKMIVFGAASGELVNLSNREILASNKTLTGYFLGSYFPHHLDRVGEATNKLLGWINEGKLQLMVGHTFPLAQAREAYDLMESRQSTGKIVLVP